MKKHQIVFVKKDLSLIMPRINVLNATGMGIIAYYNVHQVHLLINHLINAAKMKKNNQDLVI